MEVVGQGLLRRDAQLLPRAAAALVRSQGGHRQPARAADLGAARHGIAPHGPLRYPARLGVDGHGHDDRPQRRGQGAAVADGPGRLRLPAAAEPPGLLAAARHLPAARPQHGPCQQGGAAAGPRAPVPRLRIRLSRPAEGLLLRDHRRAREVHAALARAARGAAAAVRARHALGLRGRHLGNAAAAVRRPLPYIHGTRGATRRGAAAGGAAGRALSGGQLVVAVQAVLWRRPAAAPPT